MKNNLIKTKYGYLSIEKLPSEKELEVFYSKKYFQEENGLYHQKYTKDELEYFSNISEIAYFIYQQKYKKRVNKLLDVGAGEGFFSKLFFDKNTSITTLDYSSYGMKQQNPHILNFFKEGNVFELLDTLSLEGKSYDFINLSNVLEHVLDPIELLNKLKLLFTKESLLRISVPNDYSEFQKFLLNKGYTKNTWLCPPSHLHYFTFNSLINLLESLNYEIIIKIGEFPIEIFLSNLSSNYYQNSENGKYAHQSRIEIDNFLFKEGIENYINYYKACADIGFSRQVVIFARYKGSK